MTSAAVLAAYQAKVEGLRQATLAALDEQNNAVIALVALAALTAWLFFAAFKQNSIPLWYPALPLPVIALNARRIVRSRQKFWRLRRLDTLYQRGIQRVSWTWMGEGAGGEDLADPGHIYAADLSIFGEGSLFELLCTARTAIGKRALAQYLTSPVTAGEALLRQESTAELRPRIDLRERLALLGKYSFEECRWEIIVQWLDGAEVLFPRGVRRLAFLLTCVTACIPLLGVFGLVPFADLLWPVGISFACQGLLGLVLQDRVTAVLGSAKGIASEIAMVRQGCELILSETFTCAKMRQLQEKLASAGVPAPRALRRLERMVMLSEERNKDWFYLPSLALFGGTHLAIGIEEWRNRHGVALRDWMEAWGEFEALNAIAGYAYEHPGDPFPEFASHGPVFEAEQLGHPLLREEVCVCNDISLNSARQFYVVSGSNMAGKSTFLRAIGINAVLAFAGAPVRASRLRLSALDLCGSIMIHDSLLTAKSRFLAEVERLAEMVKRAASGRGVLFLIDEMLSGTNSNDRRIAAEAVIRSLAENRAIGLLSTHDLALTEIAAIAGLHGTNIHFSERPDAGPLDFDYLLHAGVVRQSNALAIVRMVGIPHVPPVGVEN